jgi:ribosomal protein L11 methylase PrmA
MQPVQFPLNEVQISLLKLSENLSADELQALKQLIIAFKAQRLAKLADQNWDEKSWTQETMQQFLQTHMRTPYKQNQPNNEA